MARSSLAKTAVASLISYRVRTPHLAAVCWRQIRALSLWQPRKGVPVAARRSMLIPRTHMPNVACFPTQLQPQGFTAPPGRAATFSSCATL